MRQPPAGDGMEGIFNGKILHIVAGCDNMKIYVITVYYPEIKKFEDDLKTRRKE